jgi:hypothetical protein
MIRIVFYAIIFYFVYRLLDSFFRPNKARAGQNTGAPRQKVTVQYDRKKAKSKVSREVGEYVDFEEVKEDK